MDPRDEITTQAQHEREWELGDEELDRTNAPAQYCYSRCPCLPRKHA